MPTTWKLWSQDVYGEVREQTPAREKYVAYKKIEKWLAEGHNAGDIAQIWNTGRAGACIKGINKNGVSFDSCIYEKKVLSFLQ